MKKFITSILEGFEYTSLHEFTGSLFPALKYNILLLTITLSAVLGTVKEVFGLSALSILALILVMVFELASGTYAAQVSKVPFSSRKLSRFTFKAACYMLLIAVPYILSTDFARSENSLASSLFGWLHTFLVTQIVIENIISILENIAVIQGKEKTHWIDIIKSKFNIK